MGVGALRRTSKKLTFVGVLALATYFLTIPFNSRVQEVNLSIAHVTAAQAWKYASDLNNLKEIDSNVIDLQILDDENKMGVWTYTALIQQDKPYIGRIAAEAKYTAKQSGKDYVFTEAEKVCKFWMCVNNHNRVLFRNTGDSHHPEVHVVVTMESSCPLLLHKWPAESMRNDFIHWLHRMKERLERNALPS